MNPIVRKHLNNAIQIVEGFRYSMGVNQFIENTINCWAYHQTGVYPPVLSKDWSEEANSGAIAVSIQLSAAMMADPLSDALGWFLSETGYYKVANNFYPTPPEVAKLLASLVGGTVERTKYSHYEICAGTGILTLSYLDEILSKEGAEALNKVTLVLEEINPLIVKCCLIQLLHYLDAKNVRIGGFKLEAVNTLTRASTGLVYFAHPRGFELGSEKLNAQEDEVCYA